MDKKPERTELHCTSSESGQKLLKHLLRTTDGTKIYLYKLFRKGDIKVNGRAVDQTYAAPDGEPGTEQIPGGIARSVRFV
jgi:23S rRNA-/tRNA-specific pseudouridylate synthase